MLTGVAVACGIVLVVFAVAGLVMGRVQARPQLHELRCPGCGREQQPADLARVSWMNCSDPTCAYVILNRSGKTGPAPGWPPIAMVRPPPPSPQASDRRKGGAT